MSDGDGTFLESRTLIFSHCPSLFLSSRTVIILVVVSSRNEPDDDGADVTASGSALDVVENKMT